jgi:hypothetical protein
MSIILVAILFSWWFDQVAGPEEIPISQFVEHVESGDYEQVVLLARSHRAQARLGNSELEPGTFDQVAAYVEGFEEQLTNIIIENGVELDVGPASFQGRRARGGERLRMRHLA